MRRTNSPSSTDPTVAGAVARFALAGVIALAIVGVVSFFVTKRIGTSEAQDNAKEITRIVGRGIVQPRLTLGVLRGNPAAIAKLDRLVRARVLEDPIVRIKVWTAQGRLVYSDEPRLIGHRFDLQPDDLYVLKHGGVESGVSDLSRPENRFERSQGKLLEVYLPVRGPDGKPLLFEAYQRFSSIAASGRNIWLAFAPALIIALLVLELIQLPLASSMARRITRASREREALLQRAVDASAAERRRIAGDLHDGIVQDLAGLSFSLAAAAKRVGPGSEADAATVLRRGAEETRRSVRGLRSLLVEIYPPNLQQAGLRSAISDLVAPLAGRGIETHLDIPEDLDLETAEEALIYRVAQETTRNVAAHAGARRLDLSVAEEDGRVTLVVRDDGRGFDPEAIDSARGGGHFGLSLLQDLAAETGGRLEIDSTPGRGTTVRLEVPRA